jgi:hypothetical protein
LKDIIVTVAVIALLLAYGSRVAFLEQCRNYDETGLSAAVEFLWNGCPVDGPYGPDSNVYIYALFHPWKGS